MSILTLTGTSGGSIGPSTTGTITLNSADLSIVGDGTANTLTLFLPSGTSGQVLLAATGGPPSFATLTSHTGTLSYLAGPNSLNIDLTAPVPASYGGTGVINPPEHSFAIAQGSNAFRFIELGNNQILIGASGLDPVPATLTAGPGIGLDHSNGTLTISLTATCTYQSNFGKALPKEHTITIQGTETQGITSSATEATLTISAKDATTAQKGVVVLSSPDQAIMGQDQHSAVTPEALNAKLGAQTSHAVILGGGDSRALRACVAGGNGQLLIGATQGDPAFASINSLTNTVRFQTGPNSLSIDLASPISAIHGGTGRASPPLHSFPVAQGDAPFQFVGPLQNGQILIGVTDSNPVPKTLTGGRGIQIIESPGDITIALPPIRDTLIPDIGPYIHLVTDTLILTGTGGLETVYGDESTLIVNNLRWGAPYVVDASTATGSRGTHQTVQAAINAAHAAGGGLILIRPGTYTEQITLYSNITLSAVAPEGSSMPITLNGSLTCADSGTITLNGLVLTNATTATVLDCTNSAAALTLNHCTINASAGDALRAGSTTQITLYHSTITAQNFAVVLSGTATLKANQATLVSNGSSWAAINLTENSSATLNSCSIFSEDFGILLSSPSTSFSSSYSSYSTAWSCLKFLNSASALSRHDSFVSRDPTGYCVAGFGTFNYGNLLIQGSSSIDGNITQVPLPTFPTAASQPTTWTWTVITEPQTLATHNGYFCNGTSQLTLALPETSSVGDIVTIAALNEQGWQITQVDGQSIQLGGSSSTTGTSGSISATTMGATVTLICSIANTNWYATSYHGSITLT